MTILQEWLCVIALIPISVLVLNGSMIPGKVWCEGKGLIMEKQEEYQKEKIIEVPENLLIRCYKELLRVERCELVHVDKKVIDELRGVFE